MFKYRGVFLILGLLALASCSNDVEDVGKKGNVQGDGRLKSTKNSSFVAEQARSLSISYSSEYSQQWQDIPTHALIEFQTCLKDIAKALPIIDQRFSIESPQGQKKRFTQTNGCLTWTELIPFNLLEKERLINYPIKIKGLGRYPGVYELDLAVNPWPMANQHLVDKDHIDPVHSTKLFGQSYSHTRQDENLNLDNINWKLIKREVDHDKKVEVLTYDLELGLNIQHRDIQGRHHSTKLSQGLFNIELALIEKDRDNDSVYLIGQTRLHTQLTESKIKERVVIEVAKERAPKSHSPIELFLSITPEVAPEGLNPRQGLLDMDGLNTLQNQEFKDITTQSDEKITSLGAYARSRRNDDKQDSRFFDDDFGVKMDKVNLRWGSLVGQGDHLKSERTLRANFSTCLKNPLSNDQSEPLTDSHFSVRVYPEAQSDRPLGQERVSRVDSNGCLNSHFNMTYNFYEAPRWIPIVIELTGLNGEARGVIKERVVEVNPWNKNEFGYDTSFEEKPKMTNSRPPRVVLPEIGYASEGKDLDGFRLNKFMQMSFAKNYQIKLSPKLELSHSYEGNQQLESINFGDYDMHVYVFSPKNNDIDYQNIDLTDFDFLTASKKEVTVNSAGNINASIGLPFYFTETFQLPYKNLIVIKLKSKTQDIESGLFAVPFYSNDKQGNLVASEIPKEQEELLEHEEIVKVLNLGIKDVEEVLTQKQKSMSTIDFYRNEFMQKTQEVWKSKGEFLALSRKELNELDSVGGKSLSSEDKSLTVEDFRILSTQSGDMPNQVLNKLCRHFFPLPQERSLRGLGPSRDNLVGGELYLECMEGPRASLKTQALTHIQEILSKGRENDQEGLRNRYGKGVLSHQEKGNIKISVGFVAGDGERSWKADGTQDVTSFTTGAELFLHAPAPLLMVFNSGVSQAHEMVSQMVDSNMQYVYDQTNRQLEKPALEYNKIELAFTASVRRCFTVTNKKGLKKAMHICEEEDRLTQLKEQWFFIAQKDSQKSGTITDPLRPGDSTYTQIIRGQAQFNRLWDQFKAEDVTFLIQTLPGKELYRPLIRHRVDEEKGAFFREYYDQNYPGLMTPFDIVQ